MQQALRYNNDMSTRSALSCFIISKLFLLLYVVVDLVISSLLFSRERAKQSTHLLHVTRVFQIVIAKFLKRLLVESLTLYALRSECIFSTLFSIHFLRRREGESVY